MSQWLKELERLYAPHPVPRALRAYLGAQAMTPQTLDLAGYRFRNDDGSETTATWKANENTSATIAVDTNFRLRIVVDETGGGTSAGVLIKLQYDLNDNNWNDVTSTSNVCRPSLTDNFAEDDPTTRQLTSGTGTFQQGSTDETDTIVGSSGSLVAGNIIEFEFSLQLRSADLSNGQTVRLRAILNSGTVFAAYSQIPTLTVSAGVSGTQASTEAADTASASGTVLNPVSGSQASTEADDTASASGTETFSGSQASTEADDTASASGTETFSGSQASTEADDTASAEGAETFSGSQASTEADDAGEAAGEVIQSVTGSQASTEGDDAASADGEVINPVSGAQDSTEQGDAGQADGAVAYIGSQASAEAEDTGEAEGAITYSGSQASTEAEDTGAAEGEITVTGSQASVEAEDTASAEGEVVSSGVEGAQASVEDEDTALASGEVLNPVTGEQASAEANDTAQASGVVGVEAPPAQVFGRKFPRFIPNSELERKPETREEEPEERAPVAFDAGEMVSSFGAHAAGTGSIEVAIDAQLSVGVGVRAEGVAAGLFAETSSSTLALGARAESTVEFRAPAIVNSALFDAWASSPQTQGMTIVEV